MGKYTLASRDRSQIHWPRFACDTRFCGALHGGGHTSLFVRQSVHLGSETGNTPAPVVGHDTQHGSTPLLPEYALRHSRRVAVGYPCAFVGVGSPARTGDNGRVWHERYCDQYPARDKQGVQKYRRVMVPAATDS